MPDYGLLLKEECVWEWKAYYLNYDRLKGWIREMESSKSEKAIQMFHEELEQSLERVHQFYLAQAKLLESSFQKYQECFHHGDCPSEDLRSAQDLDSSRKLTEEIERLKCFANQNVEGFRKIAKKYDKNVKNLMDTDIEFDIPKESLQARVVGMVKSFPFASADVKLGKMSEAIKRASPSGGRRMSMIRQPSLGNLVADASPDLDAHLQRPEKRKAAHLYVTFYLGRLIVKLLLLETGVLAIAASISLNFGSSSLKFAGWIVIWVTAVVLTFLVLSYSSDMVLITATLFLTICGILDQKDAWAAFSDDVVLSVACLGVVAYAVEQTGVIDIVFGYILGKPKSLPVAMFRLFIPAIILNVCISNTCVMSCLLSLIDKWSADIGFPKAFFLMPLSYVLLISGTFAIFSTSTNLIAQGLLISHGLPGFDNFALAIPALTCTAVTVVYLIFVAPLILRRFGVKNDGTATRKTSFSTRLQNRYDVRVQITGRVFKGETIESSGLLKKLQGGSRDILARERYGTLDYSPLETSTLELDDILWLRTSLDGVSSFFHTSGISFLAFDLADEWATLDQSTRQLVEAVLDSQSPLIGHRLGSARKYRPEYDCPIVAFRAFNEAQGEDCSSVDAPLLAHEVGATPETRLQRGDHIIMNASGNFYKHFKDSSDFVVLRVCVGDASNTKVDNYRALVAGLILLMLIALVSTSTLPLLEAVLLSLVTMVFCNITTMDAIVRAVKLRTVLTIVGAFGLGKAIGQQGVAEVLANMLIYALSPFGTRGMLIAVFSATVALGVIFHGTAVVVLMFPICQQVAETMSIPIHQIVAVLCLSVSCQMLTPISYQTNLMAYSAATYQFADFTKVGFGLVFCIAVVAIPLCERTFPA